MTTAEVLQGPDDRLFIHVHTGDVTLLTEITDDEFELLERTVERPHPLRKRHPYDT
ncbi:hypothetical protein [Halocatena halophila]|uniref:hypothetical protein n=1 Tax=Halocatena halophila TaxID=2814576 RepID=UPI002ED0F595